MTTTASTAPLGNTCFDTVCGQVQSLPRSDKYRLMQFIVADLAKDDCLALLQPGGEFPVWSPFDAHDAARVLHQLLEDEKAGK